MNLQKKRRANHKSSVRTKHLVDIGGREVRSQDVFEDLLRSQDRIARGLAARCIRRTPEIQCCDSCENRNGFGSRFR